MARQGKGLATELDGLSSIPLETYGDSKALTPKVGFPHTHRHTHMPCTQSTQRHKASRQTNDKCDF